MTIVEANSDPVVGASVRIGDETQISDDLGVVEFSLEYGDYVVTISKEGYVTGTETVAFRSNHKNFGYVAQPITEGGT